MSMPSTRLLACILLLAACSDESSTIPDGGVVVTNDAAAADVLVVSGDTGTSGDVMTSGLVPTFTQVYAIITSRCTPCHTTAGGIGISLGHLDMTTKAAAFLNLVNAPTSGVSHGQRYARHPGDEETSIMYLKVSLDDPTPCGAKMPLGLPALPQAEADAMRELDQGRRSQQLGQRPEKASQGAVQLPTAKPTPWSA